MIIKTLKSINTYLRILNLHTIDENKKDIFIFSAPRSGSTWLMEMIASQQGVKYYSEPTNIREPYIKKKMKVASWDDLLPNEDRYKIFEEFFSKLYNNKVKLYNPSPFRPLHHFITDRIVFKMMYANDMIPWFEDKYKGHIIFLIRHPIPVSVSRKMFPVLGHFINNKIYMEKYFNSRQISLAKKIFEEGSHLEKGIVDWAIQNTPPLKFFNKDKWIFITYEELVLSTEECILLLYKQLKLNDKDKILKMSKRASKTAKTMSDKETLKYLNSDNKTHRAEYLLGKWRMKISKDEEKRVFEILNEFETDIYSINNLEPKKEYLNFPMSINN